MTDSRSDRSDFRNRRGRRRLGQAHLAGEKLSVGSLPHTPCSQRSRDLTQAAPQKAFSHQSRNYRSAQAFVETFVNVHCALGRAQAQARLRWDTYGAAR